MQQTLPGWLRNTAGTPLYAVLANTNGAEGIKAYFRGLVHTSDEAKAAHHG
jgi:hypothetical protein